MQVSIRPAREADRQEWQRLFRDYAHFYGQTISRAHASLVWAWILDPDHEVHALVAEPPGGAGLSGFAHLRPFARPLDGSTGGWLDDLYVEPVHRRAGYGAALLSAARAEAAQRGWSVLRWVTKPDNDTARALYDHTGQCTTWLTYDSTIHPE